MDKAFTWIIFLVFGLSALVMAGNYYTPPASGAVSSSGVIGYGLEIYGSFPLDTKLENLSWGTLQPGDSVNRTIYILNKREFPVTLSINTTAWAPSEAETFFILSWDYSDQVLRNNQYVNVTLTLFLSSGVQNINSFNFDIVIVGNE